jgi:putative Mg2+ transporter-C (MgtC) family protein
MACGAAIGIERERAAKPAGVRTHALVGGSACLLVTLGMVLLQEFVGRFPSDAMRGDPIGLIAAVVTGVTFLGAGTIIRGRGEHVEGLTTAASILFTAAVGITIATGRYGLAVILTGVVTLTLHLPYLLTRTSTRQ